MLVTGNPLVRLCFGFCRFFPAEEFVGGIGGFGRPFAFRLQLQQVFLLLDADYRPASREPVAAHKRAFLALPDDKLTLPAFITLQSRRLSRRLRRRDIAILIKLNDCLAVGIIAASEERAESPVFVNQGFAAVGTFVLADFLLDHFTLLVALPGKLALRIAGATQEFTLLAETIN